jgi:hypothetical protein
MPHNALIVITNKKKGDSYLCSSYPDDDSDNNNKIELHRTPAYKVLIKGISVANSSQAKERPAVRFMPYWNDPKTPDKYYKTKGWVNSGLYKLDKRKVTYYNPNYGTQNRYSPYSGAIQLRDSFLIHAGPQNLRDIGWDSAG